MKLTYKILNTILDELENKVETDPAHIRGSLTEATWKVVRQEKISEGTPPRK